VYSDAAKIASVDHISCLITGPTGTDHEDIFKHINGGSPPSP
jgi:hypothetical protein